MDLGYYRHDDFTYLIVCISVEEDAFNCSDPENKPRSCRFMHLWLEASIEVIRVVCSLLAVRVAHIRIIITFAFVSSLLIDPSVSIGLANTLVLMIVPVLCWESKLSRLEISSVGLMFLSVLKLRGQVARAILVLIR